MLNKIKKKCVVAFVVYISVQRYLQALNVTYIQNIEWMYLMHKKVNILCGYQTLSYIRTDFGKVEYIPNEW